ncbi:hypothetical protein J7366_17705, partial [Xanthomonas phaseoli pv. dieffenbachiae]|uniref:hypothetical protein n=1 Tax=Xanthomonas phaseoli TaxID=1985254 RepID=UPI001ADA83BB
MKLSLGCGDAVMRVKFEQRMECVDGFATGVAPTEKQVLCTGWRGGRTSATKATGFRAPAALTLSTSADHDHHHSFLVTASRHPCFAALLL